MNRRRSVQVAVALVSWVVLAAGCSSASDSAAAPKQNAVPVTSTTTLPFPTTIVPDPTAIPAEAVLCRKIKKPEGAGAKPEPTPQLRAKAEEIELNFAEVLDWMTLGDKPAYERRITVGLNTRDPDVMLAVIDLVGPESVCFDLPPPGFDDETPVPAIWTVEGSPSAEATSLTLLVDDPTRACGHNPNGRVLPPVVEESKTEIRITVELTPVFGGGTCEGYGPTPYTVELSQPLGGRLVTGSP